MFGTNHFAGKPARLAPLWTRKQTILLILLVHVILIEGRLPFRKHGDRVRTHVKGI